MQEAMMMKFAYSAAIVVGITAVTALVVGLVMLFWAYRDGLIRIQKSSNKSVRFKVAVGKWRLMVMAKYLILVSTDGPARILYDHDAVRAYFDRIKVRVLEYSLRITPWPVYYWHIERDCDHYWVERPVAYPNGWTAWERMNSAYDNAEGPCSFTKLSRAEYLEACEAGPVGRDAAAEAMGY